MTRILGCGNGEQSFCKEWNFVLHVNVSVITKVQLHSTSIFEYNQLSINHTERFTNVKRSMKSLRNRSYEENSISQLHSKTWNVKAWSQNLNQKVAKTIEYINTYHNFFIERLTLISTTYFFIYTPSSEIEVECQNFVIELWSISYGP